MFEYWLLRVSNKSERVFTKGRLAETDTSVEQFERYALNDNFLNPYPAAINGQKTALLTASNKCANKKKPIHFCKREVPCNLNVQALQNPKS